VKLVAAGACEVTEDGCVVIRIVASGNSVSVNKLSVGGTDMATRVSYCIRVFLKAFFHTQPCWATPGVLSAEGMLTP
jgi:hypothetical protein